MLVRQALEQVPKAERLRYVPDGNMAIVRLVLADAAATQTLLSGFYILAGTVKAAGADDRDRR